LSINNVTFKALLFAVTPIPSIIAVPFLVAYRTPSSGIFNVSVCPAPTETLIKTCVLVEELTVVAFANPLIIAVPELPVEKIRHLWNL
jgi:hypothetical protein